MKWRLAILVVLLLGSVVLIPVAHGQISAPTKAVEIYETVLEGDASAAEGIVLKLSPNISGNLFWDVTYNMSGDTVTETRFHDKPSWPDYITSPQSVGWYTFRLSGYHFGLKSQLDLEEPNRLDFLTLLGKDVATRTAPDELHTEILTISDYYEFYPFDWFGKFYFAPHKEEDMAQRQALMDFFRIPVLEGQQVSVSVETDELGDPYAMDYAPVDEDQIFDISGLIPTSGGDYAYLFLQQHTEKTLDFSHIPGGYGIYRVPMVKDVYDWYDKTGKPDFTQLEIVFHLPETTIVEWFVTSDDRSALYLITRNENGRSFMVVDIETMTERQSFSLEERGPIGPITQFAVYDSGVLLYLEDEILYLHMDEAGMLSLVMRAAFPDDVLASRVFPALAYDGERLALLTAHSNFEELYGRYDWSDEKREESERNYEEYQTGKEGKNCRLYFMIFQDDSLQYLSFFDNSLDDGHVTLEKNYDQTYSHAFEDYTYARSTHPGFGLHFQPKG